MPTSRSCRAVTTSRPPTTYRSPFNETDPEKLATLEDEILSQGANTIAAFIMEPALGAGGVIPPHKNFLPNIRKICDRHGILLISDEVITAFGRTGSESGARHFGMKPDMMCTAKAITNGYFPFGAVMIADRLAETFEKDRTGQASIDIGYAYSGHPVGAAAALAALGEVRHQRVHENAGARRKELLDGLQNLQQKHDLIGDVRGEGLMCALELVSDRACKKPVAKEVPLKLQKSTYDEGVMIRVSGNNVILSPPLVIDSGHVEQILKALDKALNSL